MSNILTMQPRNPVTATYVILGTAIAYVCLWGITSDLFKDVLIISAVGGVIASLLYYLEPLQYLGIGILRGWYLLTVRRQFPKDEIKVNYDETFGEPYFRDDRNKIYGAGYLFFAIEIVFSQSSITQSIPLVLLYGAYTRYSLLIVVVYLAIKRRKRLKAIHYILALERDIRTTNARPADLSDIVDTIKDDLLAERWTSVMNRIENKKEEFYDSLKHFHRDLLEFKEKWAKGNFTFTEIRLPLSPNSFEINKIHDYPWYMRDWLYVLDPKVYDLGCKTKVIISFAENRMRKKLESLLNDNKKAIILKEISRLYRGLSYIYTDETFDLSIEENVRSLCNEITEHLTYELQRNRSESVSDLNERDVRVTIEEFRNLKTIFDLIIEKIEEVETCFKKLKKIKMEWNLVTNEKFLLLRREDAEYRITVDETPGRTENGVSHYDNYTISVYKYVETNQDWSNLVERHTKSTYEKMEELIERLRKEYEIFK